MSNVVIIMDYINIIIAIRIIIAMTIITIIITMRKIGRD